MRQSDYETALTEKIGEFFHDPLGYVLFAFPWGEPGTELADFPDGPDVWQREQLNEVGNRFQADPMATIQEAISSGHGIGKSAEVSWIILWAMSTRPHLAGWVTANTQTQLKSKTWRELSIWHKRAINQHWFRWAATRFFHVDHPETWGMDAIPWTEHNSEAFAGLHAKYVLIIMDEASAIADIIWEVSEGAMTTPRAMWFCFGNPTRNTGRFRECFGKYKHRWTGRKIDSRTARMTNKKKIAEWQVDHGEDSDFFKVRVRGEFPAAGSNQLISSGAVGLARKTELIEDEYIFQPVLIGVDVARFGDDETVISVRQGRKQIKQLVFRELDNIQVAMRAAEEYRNYGEATLFVDEVGLGAGVVDYLKNMRYPVVGVNAGRQASEKDKFYNLRAEMWFRLKEWVESGADIVDDPDLAEQLAGVEYDYTPKEQVRMEKKEDMKSRGMSSPDRADALALTFAQIVAPNAQLSSFEPDDY
ncbi:MAG: terminase [Nitrosomonas sp.]|nr:terminase [Nitrosomonas sp.]